jgi:hypothetical protein
MKVVWHLTGKERLMNYISARLPSDDEMREIDMVLQGYTVTGPGGCLARIGAEYVMRDGARPCVRISVAGTATGVLAAKWAEFSHPATEVRKAPATRDAMLSGIASPKDVTIVLQGYMTSSRGVCLARVVGNYVTRDGLRHCIRFLVDNVDPVTLGAAWAAFSDAAGWIGAASVDRAESADQPIGYWNDAGEERRASG